MLSDSAARDFATEWIRAWNSHDLDAIMSHYATDVTLISPAVSQILGDSSGTVRGKDALRRYFQSGLEAYPNLTFQLLDVLRGFNSVVLYYVNQRSTKTAEFMEFDANHKVIKVVANYT